MAKPSSSSRVEAFLDGLSTGSPSPSDPLEPRLDGFICVESPGRPERAVCRRILEQYATRGYALFELAGEADTSSGALVDLMAALALGSPFVPPLYGGSGVFGLYDEHGVNVLAASGPRERQASHPVFESRAALELHTDGTLQGLGELPTAALFCVTPAVAGGETTVFRAVDAFLALAAEQPELARPLLDERALTRHATVNGSQASCAGPVFALRDGEVLTRYSMTPRDHWALGEVELLREAFEALAALAQPQSKYWVQIRLGARQGIVLANDKVAHGRTSFEDAPGSARRMLRALFLRRPS